MRYVVYSLYLDSYLSSEGWVKSIGLATEYTSLDAVEKVWKGVRNDLGAMVVRRGSCE